MKIAVIGYGNIARRHLDNIHTLVPEAQVMVLRASPAPLEPRHSWALQARDMDEVLAFAPHAAVIASPASLHVAQGLALAAIGVSLLVEKPLAMRTDEARELVEYCEKRGILLSVAYNLAYHGLLSEFISLVQVGAVGQTLSVQAAVGQYLPDWRPGVDYRKTASAVRELGGGVLLELSHDVEYVDRLIGGTRKIYCQTRQSGVLETDVEDTALIVLTNDRGVAASLQVNMVQKTPCRCCSVTGTEGIIEIDIIEGNIVIRKDRDKHLIRGADPEARAETYVRELKNFFDSAGGEMLPVCDGRRGLRILELIDAARRSALEGEALWV